MIESLEHRECLIRIAEKLRPLKQSIPTDDNGNPTEEYLEYLSLMFPLKVAEIIQFLKPIPRFTFLGRLSKKVGRPKDEIKEILEKPANQLYLVKFKGLYALPLPLFVFDGPFILKSSYDGEHGKKFAKLGKKNFDEGYYKVWETHEDGTPEMRVLAVDVEIERNSVILPADEILKLIKKSKSFAKVPCACRNREEALGNRRCKHIYPIHSCLLMGRYGKFIKEYKDPYILEISRDEAIEHVKKSAKLGLVLTSENVKNRSKIICSCCDCCCTFMKGLLNLGNPKAMAKGYYTFHIDTNLCVGCGTCKKWCKFNAIHIDEIGIIDTEKCMGCGLCTLNCQKNAIYKEKL